MKKNILRILAALTAAAVMLSFAACGGKEEADPSAESSDNAAISENAGENGTDEASEVPGETDASEGETESKADDEKAESEAPAKPGETKPADDKKPTETKPASGDKTPVKKPDSKADIISAYNKAIGTSSLSRRKMTQTLTKGNIAIPGGYDIMAADKAEVRNKINVNDTSKAASDLKALNSANVASATRSGNTVTINLNSASAGLNDITNGKGGYVGVVDKARTDFIVKTIVADIGVNANNVVIQSANYTLSNGVIKATFNDDFTKITKVTFSGNESMNGVVKYKVLTIKADVACKLTSEYSA